MAKRRSPASLKELREQYAASHVVPPPGVLRALARDARPGARQLYKLLNGRAGKAAQEHKRLDAMLHFERVLWKAGIHHIAGVDEVGIGPLAGPVIAAAVIFPPGTVIDGVDDSKVLDEETRTRLDEEIRSKALAFAIGRVEVEDIDRINIYNAGLHAMELAVKGLPVPAQHVLVDSRTIPNLDMPQNSFDKGDGLSFSIAAASIVAKVHRDGLMREIDLAYPGYGFAIHKGYATPEHQRAIRERGPCAIHRKSFDYIRELCGEYSALYYSLKEAGGRITRQSDIPRWTKSVKQATNQLSPMEKKKLQLLARRLWQRLAVKA